MIPVLENFFRDYEGYIAHKKAWQSGSLEVWQQPRLYPSWLEPSPVSFALGKGNTLFTFTEKNWRWHTSSLAIDSVRFGVVKEVFEDRALIKENSTYSLFRIDPLSQIPEKICGFEPQDVTCHRLVKDRVLLGTLAGEVYDSAGAKRIFPEAIKWLGLLGEKTVVLSGNTLFLDGEELCSLRKPPVIAEENLFCLEEGVVRVLSSESFLIRKGVLSMFPVSNGKLLLTTEEGMLELWSPYKLISSHQLEEKILIAMADQQDNLIAVAFQPGSVHVFEEKGLKKLYSDNYYSQRSGVKELCFTKAFKLFLSTYDGAYFSISPIEEKKELSLKELLISKINFLTGALFQMIQW